MATRDRVMISARNRSRDSRSAGIVKGPVGSCNANVTGNAGDGLVNDSEAITRLIVLNPLYSKDAYENGTEDGTDISKAGWLRRRR